MDSPDPDQRQARWTSAPRASAETLAKRELSAALREVLEALPGSGADVDSLRQAGRHARALAEEVAATRRERPSGGQVAGMADFGDRGPITGLSNPIAPPFAMWPDWEKRIALGEGRFGSAYEGGPGIAHGGFVAAVLDEILGVATIFSGGPGMTAELTVRYRRPTPLHIPLRLVARLDERRGRRLMLSGELLAGEELLADASGLFIAVSDTKFEELDRQRREGRPR